MPENSNDFNCTIQELKPGSAQRHLIACRFQLHHTGIKTETSRKRHLYGLAHFNCTIQELKRLLSTKYSCLLSNFNCTIQELKPHKLGVILSWITNFNCTIQELKHEQYINLIGEAANFNCTIQELKRHNQHLYCANYGKFQLHHTGIKTALVSPLFMENKKFQLHHTGIKTFFYHYIKPVVGISIAPYRN